MPVVGRTKVLPQLLRDTRELFADAGLDAEAAFRAEVQDAPIRLLTRWTPASPTQLVSAQP